MQKEDRGVNVDNNKPNIPCESFFKAFITSSGANIMRCVKKNEKSNEKKSQNLQACFDVNNKSFCEYDANSVDHSSTWAMIELNEEQYKMVEERRYGEIHIVVHKKS